MAKIEIKGTPEKLERIAIFLKTNNIDYSMTDDYGNHSVEDRKKYQELMLKYNRQADAI